MPLLGGKQGFSIKNKERKGNKKKQRTPTPQKKGGFTAK